MDASSSEEKQEKNGLLTERLFRDKVKNSLNEESSNPMLEFQEKYFAPGTKGHFEKNTPLPLLSATNLLILRRLKSGTKDLAPYEDEADVKIEAGSNGRFICFLKLLIIANKPRSKTFKLSKIFFYSIVYYYHNNVVVYSSSILELMQVLKHSATPTLPA